MNSDRGKLLRAEPTGLARSDQPALDASPVDALMELIVELLVAVSAYESSSSDEAWRRPRHGD